VTGKINGAVPITGPTSAGGGEGGLVWEEGAGRLPLWASDEEEEEEEEEEWEIPEDTGDGAGTHHTRTPVLCLTECIY